MRTVKERKPASVKNGKPTYNPGYVDCYQKPWYIPFNNNIEYYGRFCEDGYPGNIRLEFGPLRDLLNKIDPTTDPTLKKEILVMIEEMEDAHRAEVNSYIRCLPSAD